MLYWQIERGGRGGLTCRYVCSIVLMHRNEIEEYINYMYSTCTYVHEFIPYDNGKTT